MIGKSNTGTGKTAAFSIPILEQMGQLPQEERRSVCALILCPTRELASTAAKMRLLTSKGIDAESGAVFRWTIEF